MIDPGSRVSCFDVAHKDHRLPCRLETGGSFAEEGAEAGLETGGVGGGPSHGQVGVPVVSKQHAFNSILTPAPCNLSPREAEGGKTPTDTRTDLSLLRLWDHCPDTCEP